MKKVLLSKSSTFTWIPLVLMFLLASVSGCKKTSPERKRDDPVVYAIRRAVINPAWPAEVRNRADFAISQWENGVLDPQPIIIWASLTKAEGYDEIHFSLSIFDEDKDILGVGIRELYPQSNDQQKEIVETYAVFAHARFLDVMDLYRIPFKVRENADAKNDRLWQEYVDSDYEQLLQEYKGWRASIPPVYISIPQHQDVRVSVWVYDKAGNKSDLIELLNYINYQEENAAGENNK